MFYKNYDIDLLVNFLYNKYLHSDIKFGIDKCNIYYTEFLNNIETYNLNINNKYISSLYDILSSYNYYDEKIFKNDCNKIIKKLIDTNYISFCNLLYKF